MSRSSAAFGLLAALAALPPVLFFSSLFAADPTSAWTAVWWALPAISGFVALIGARLREGRSEAAQPLSAGFGASIGIGLLVFGCVLLWLFAGPLDAGLLGALLAGAALFVGWYAALAGAVSAIVASWVARRMDSSPPATRI